MTRSAGLSAAAPRTDVAAWSVSALACSGSARLNGSHTPMWIDDVGVEPGDQCRRCDRVDRARRGGTSACGRRRRGGSASMPSERADPRLRLRAAGDRAAEFAADAADEDPPSAHHGNASRHVLRWLPGFSCDPVFILPKRDTQPIMRRGQGSHRLIVPDDESISSSAPEVGLRRCRDHSGGPADRSGRSTAAGRRHPPCPTTVPAVRRGTRARSPSSCRPAPARCRDPWRGRAAAAIGVRRAGPASSTRRMKLELNQQYPVLRTASRSRSSPVGQSAAKKLLFLVGEPDSS